MRRPSNVAHTKHVLPFERRPAPPSLALKFREKICFLSIVAITQMSRKFEITVPSKWSIPSFFASASPDEVAVALEAAAKIVPWVTKHMHAHQDQQEAARRQGIDEAVQAALQHLRNDEVERALQEKHNSEVAVYDVRTQLGEAHTTICELKQAVASTKQQLNDAEARGRAAAVLECDRRIRTEIERAVEYRSTLETELRRRIDDTVRERDTLRTKCERLEQTERELQDKTRQLEQPLGRGDAGEADVNRIVERLGFHQYDTSKFKHKDKYGDILCCIGVEEDGAYNAATQANATGVVVTPPSAGHGVVRLAIEVKNRQKVTSTDVAAFEKKVRDGVSTGLFEGGLFVSLGCHIGGMASCAKQTLLEDAEGRPTIPMGYVCGEKGDKGSKPQRALEEHIEVILQSHMHLCEQVAAVRFVLSGEEMDEHDVKRVQAHFMELSEYTNDMFNKFSQHQALLDNSRKSLESMRKTTLLMYRTARRINVAVPWLQRPMAHLSFEKGIDHAVRLMAESRLEWRNVSHKEAVFHAMTRDTAQQVVNEELRRVTREANDSEEAHLAKRARIDETDVTD